MASEYIKKLVLKEKVILFLRLKVGVDVRTEKIFS